jgi:hypothetical protein
MRPEFNLRTTLVTIVVEHWWNGDDKEKTELFVAKGDEH